MNKTFYYIRTIFFAFVLSVVLISSGVKPAQAEAITGETVYEYNRVIEKNITTDIPVVPGVNYDIKVFFTGIEGKTDAKPVRIYYEEVMYDQCVPNVQGAYKADGVDDRSGLLYEIATYGVTEERDFSVAAIDDTLTILVTGDAVLKKIVITPQEAKSAAKKRTIYVMSDSLAARYNSSAYPMTGWGQVLANYFTDKIEVVNRAIGGRSTLNYMNQGRLNEVLLSVCPGDYVLISFGHNDGSSTVGRACSVEDYKRYLEDYYVEGVRLRGGIPVLVTLGNQNIFLNDTVAQSFPEYVAAMKEAAEEKDCLLIDLNSMTKAYYQEVYDTLGWQALKDIVFNAYRAGIYDNYLDGAKDATHFQTYGANKLASFIAKDIYDQGFEGLSEYYNAPAVYIGVPANVGKVTLNTKKYAENYTHMEWSTVKRAEYYVIERASMDASGFVTGFEVLGYAAEGLFADPDREAGKAYVYRVFGMNSVGRSSEASNYLYVGADGVNEKDFLARLENGQTGEVTATPTPTAVPTGAASDITAPAGNDSSKTGANPAVIAGIAAAVIVAVFAVVIIVKRKK